MAPPIRASSLSRIEAAASESPRALSSMTRSIAETAKVTPAAFTTCKSIGERRNVPGAAAAAFS
jgi:hypothetical protein